MGHTKRKWLALSPIFVYFFLLYSFSLPSKSIANDTVNESVDIVSQLVTAYSQMGQMNWLSIILDSGLVIPTNITAQCNNDLHYFFESLMTTKHGGPFAVWTLRALDAFGKLPSGLLEGDFNSLGRFHECIELEIYKNGGNSPDFTGKYCLAFIVIVNSEGKPMFPAHPKLGVCFPSTCNEEDIAKIINYYITTTPIRLAVLKQHCQVNEGLPWEMRTIFAISVFSILICLVVVGTLKDIGNNWRNKIIPSAKSNKIFKNKSLFGKMEPVILAFSARQNFVKIITVQDNDHEMSCMHGYRFLSTVWVIVVHIFVMGVQDYPWKNILRSSQIFGNNFFVQAVTAAVFSSDSFFVMAGLLVTYHTFDQMKRFGGRFNFPVFYLHRYLRLTPAYAANLLFLSGIYKHIGEGPLWTFINDSSDKCSTHWWKNIFFIQNLWGSFYDQCFLPSWYLAVDFQMYLAAPLFLLPLYRKPKLGLMMMSTAFVITVIVPGILIYVYDMESYTGKGSRAEHMDRWTNTIYNKPWNRMSTYFIGMFVGYIFHTKGLQIKVPKKVVWICWIATIFTSCLIVFGPFEYFKGKQMSPEMFAFYGALARPGWGLCMAWILFACVTGNGGLVNTILAWKVFVPMSRLSYCIYLVHITLVHTMYYTQYEGIYASISFMVNSAISITMLSMFYGLILSLLTEAPMIQIEKIILEKYLLKTEKENTFSNPLLEEDSKELEKCERQKIVLTQKDDETNCNYPIHLMETSARRRF